MIPLLRLGVMNIAVLLIFLLLAEFALRLAAIEKPAFYQFHPVRGFSHRPGAKGWWNQEGRGWVSINKAGFRDSNHAALPTKGVLRLAVLGDSFSEAFQVNQNQTWWAQLQKQVMNKPGCTLISNYPKGLEVMNFGVGAYGTGQQLLTWRSDARHNKANLVILAVFLGNDINDNTPAARNDRPFFYLHQNGELQINNDFRQSPASIFRNSLPGRSLNWLVEHSRLAQLLNEAKNRSANPIDPNSKSNQNGPPKVAPESPSGWALTEALIKQLNTEVGAEGAKLLVVSLTSPEQVWPRRNQRPSQIFAKEKQLAALLQPLGIDYIVLAPTMQQQADQKGLILHGFGTAQGIGHWNENGHRLAAERLAISLCTE
ncbi:SGNH/GDSL hydrolase family protein [uncultured Synechococcus sp.]|uniref:SGNH/GDSL hydrolase family protein n=1 Tax=uncultured Synechococcus sp. TaxID=154535 RepID=UPI00259332AD|nr:SGNH/GDSL hydrolase family protein [uncultured Synechococcus sp.]